MRNTKKAVAGTVGLVAVAMAAVPTAAHAQSWTWNGKTTHYVGVKINVGDGWIGSYRLYSPSKTSGQFYCADPEADGPSNGGTYRGQAATARWTREGGSTLSSTTVAQLAWVVGKWGATTNNHQAAAVDAAVYALQGFKKYQVTGGYGKQRTDAAGVTARAQAMIAEAKQRAAAGSYKLSVDIPAQVAAKSSYKATVKLLNGAGRPVPGIAVTLTDAQGKKVTVNTGSNGTATAAFTNGTGAAKVTATASAPDTKLTFASPSVKSAQRVFVAGTSVKLSARDSASLPPAPTPTPTPPPPAPVRIGTTAVDKADGDKWVASGGTIIDTVRYESVEPGKTYELTGQAIDAATGQPIDGATGTVTFTPSAASGSVDVEIPLPKGVAGVVPVVEETLRLDGKVVAEHKDRNDKGQTVWVPSVRTTAIDKADGDHTVSVKGGTVVDTVALAGVQPGQTYDVSGVLVDKATGKPTAITGKATWQAEGSSGRVDVEFTIPAGVEGREFVVFETVTHNGKTIAEHKDLSDASQTIWQSKIGTTAVDKADGDHLVVAAGGTIIDTVAYEGLKPGVKYTVDGELVDTVTGKPTGIKGSATFTPTSTSGQVEVAFTVPQGYAGRSLVAFESVSDGVRIIAEHKDVNDHNQTVWVPKVATTAVDKADGDHVIPAEGGTVIDTVAYSGVQPGQDYVVSGVMFDKTTGKITTITGKSAFTAKAASGQVTVAFTVPKGYAGHELVVFETLTHKGKVAGEHANPNDKAQTVSVSKPTGGNTKVTGGGIHTGDVPGGDATLIGLGAVALMSGLGLVTVAARRRRN